jgi:hypothetical protein
MKLTLPILLALPNRVFWPEEELSDLWGNREFDHVEFATCKLLERSERTYALLRLCSNNTLKRYVAWCVNETKSPAVAELVDCINKVLSGELSSLYLLEKLEKMEPYDDDIWDKECRHKKVAMGAAVIFLECPDPAGMAEVISRAMLATDDRENIQKQQLKKLCDLITEEN